MKQSLHLIAALFGRRWWWKTLIVLAAMAFMAGLGVWQLERLEQRRLYNAQLLEKLASAPIQIDGSPLPEAAADLVDRKAEVRGQYDYSQQIAIKNQSHEGQPGVYLVTPLRIEGSAKAILVNRGWVPYREGTPDRWGQFDEPALGVLSGYLQKAQKLPNGDTTEIPATPQAEWFRTDIEAIAAQMPYELLPVYLDLAPDPTRARHALPVRVEPEIEVTEGSHFSYALQWFAFALIAGAVYVALVRRQEDEEALPVPAYDRESRESLATMDRPSH